MYYCTIAIRWLCGRPFRGGCDASDAVWCDGKVIGIPTAAHTHWVNSISVWRTKREWTSSRVSAKNQVAGTAGGAVLPLAAARINAPSAVYTFRSTAFRSRRFVFFSLLSSSSHPDMPLYVLLRVLPDFRSDIERKLQSLSLIIPVTYLIDFSYGVCGVGKVSSNNYILIVTNRYWFCPRQSRSQ